jgi:hypothetical protein
MEYNNVGASHTGHRDVFTTSDEIQLTTDVNEHSGTEILQGRTGGRTRVRTLSPPVGDKDPSGISYSTHRKRASRLAPTRFEVGRLDKPRQWE